MIRRFSEFLGKAEHDWRKSFGQDIVDPKERKKSLWHLRWLDHGILRIWWTNFSTIAPGVFRSNQPDPKRFEGYAKQGIKTVLNLRGEPDQPHYLFERESCQALGMKLVSVKMSARRAPRASTLEELMTAFETMEKPVLMHCKSGADRTGLAAALYLMLYEGVPVEIASKELSIRYLHLRKTYTGVLDHFFDVYAARNAQSPIPIDEWIRTEYDRDAVKESFAAKQKSLRFWQGWR